MHILTYSIFTGVISLLDKSVGSVNSVMDSTAYRRQNEDFSLGVLLAYAFNLGSVSDSNGWTTVSSLELFSGL